MSIPTSKFPYIPNNAMAVPHYSEKPLSSIPSSYYGYKSEDPLSDDLERLRTVGGHNDDRSQPSMPTTHRRIANPAPLGMLSFATSKPSSPSCLDPSLIRNRPRHLPHQHLWRQSPRCHHPQRLLRRSCLLRRNMSIHHWNLRNDCRQYLWGHSLPVLRRLQFSLRDDIPSWLGHSCCVYRRDDWGGQPRIFASAGDVAVGVVHPVLHFLCGSYAE